MNYFNYLLVTILAITITSCQFTEEITFNKNGSGNYKLSVDMGGMMGAMEGLKENDTVKKEYEKVDSLIFIKDILESHKDSISKLSVTEKESLEAIKDLKMHIQMDEEKGKMLMDFILDFENVSDLDNIKQKVEKAQQLQDNKGEEGKTVENHIINYSFSKKFFERKVIMKNLSSEEQELYEKNKKKTNMFLSGSTYKLVYHFPRTIKKVTYSEAVLSENKKTMTIEIPMDSVISNPQLLDFKVKFK